MTQLRFSLPLAVCVFISATPGEHNNNVASALSMPRRGFLQQATVATTGATMGWVLSQQQQLSHPGGCACGQCLHAKNCNCGTCTTGVHVAGCQCGSCVSGHDAGCNCAMCGTHDAGCNCAMCSDHGAGCNCGTCGGGLASAFRPPAAYAYEKRQVGGANPSAETAAFNIQSEKTYDRLEKSGFPLDSRAEEQARLSDALASFSYPASNAAASDKNDNKKQGKK
ncbi:expressed unknown protein [Seminavis robusta]|uniref:Uncharacterized protein n=1 Tax=Seminavis robusta TaxID=568900 RepID=A0A9N8E2H5_9STRA|nr:expressed unknown protein [Seminavis robusta]|eukprot:Sro587_g171340.1 n/a (224) ;mRNA; f:38068-38739